MKRIEKIQLLKSIAAGRATVRDIPTPLDLSKLTTPELNQLLNLIHKSEGSKGVENLNVEEKVKCVGLLAKARGQTISIN